MDLASGSPQGRPRNGPWSHLRLDFTFQTSVKSFLSWLGGGPAPLGPLGSCPGLAGLTSFRSRAGGLSSVKPASVKGVGKPSFSETHQRMEKLLLLAGSTLSWKPPSVHSCSEKRGRGGQSDHSQPLSSIFGLRRSLGWAAGALGPVPTSVFLPCGGPQIPKGQDRNPSVLTGQAGGSPVDGDLQRALRSVSGASGKHLRDIFFPAPNSGWPPGSLTLP